MEHFPRHEEELASRSKLFLLEIHHPDLFIVNLVVFTGSCARIVHEIVRIDIFVLFCRQVEQRLTHIEQAHVDVDHEPVMGKICVLCVVKPASQFGSVQVPDDEGVVPLQELFLPVFSKEDLEYICEFAIELVLQLCVVFDAVSSEFLSA